MNKIIWVVIGIIIVFAAFKAMQGLLTLGLVALGVYMVYWGYQRLSEGKKSKKIKIDN